MRRGYRLLLSRTGGVLAGGLLFALLLAGCNSDGDGPASSVIIPPSTEESALTLERFHYRAAVTLREQVGEGEARELVISTEGDFQQPDRHAFTFITRSGDAAVVRRVVLIGEEAWVRQGDDVWRMATTDDPQVAELLAVAFSTVRPGFLSGPEFDRVREAIRRLTSTDEAVNGILADRYQVGENGKEFFETFLADDRLLQNVEGLSWDLWLAQDGAWPVRLLASATITADLTILDELDLAAPVLWELRVDISRPNDPTLTVIAPLEEGG